MRKPIAIVSLALLAVLAWAGYRLVWGQPFTLNQLANRQSLQLVLDDPELFTQIGAVDGTPLDFHSGRLADVGVEARDREYATLERFIAELERFDPEALAPQDRLSQDLLLDFYGTQLEGRRFPWLSSEGLYPVSPTFGSQVELLAFMENQHPVRNAKTARHYIERLHAMGEKLDRLTAEMQRQSDAGVLMPPALVDRSIDVLDKAVAGEPEANVLVTGFAAKLAPLEDLEPADREALQREAGEAVRTAVYPAWARMRQALVELRPRSEGVAAGVWRLADGEDYYRWMLRSFTTTAYTPDEVHALGLAEVARISAEADALLAGQGLVEGTVGERLAALGKDPRFLLPNDDEGREKVLQRFREVLHEINARMPEYFGNPPRDELEVRRMPLASERGSSGAYYNPPSLDGSRPGTFYVSLRNLAELPMFEVRTLAYHEGIPGHHFQIAAAMQLKDLPLIRQQSLYSAFAEGWALYAERLAAEIGMYEGDPFGDLGRLQAELFRAARLVVDTGIHAKRWTREEAIDYMVAATGRERSDLTSEVERYMALPGQACAYKVGQLKILELRDRAKARLGDRFDLRRFHDVVLGNGTLPLTLLERTVDAWIDGGGA